MLPESLVNQQNNSGLLLTTTIYFFADSNLSFGVGSGVLIAVPFSSSLGEEIEVAIQQALSDAQ